MTVVAVNVTLLSGANGILFLILEIRCLITKTDKLTKGI